MTHAVEYFSQPATAQDQWVIERCQGATGGFFIEIGAHDGIRHSNTLTLEREFCWTGLLVEPNPSLFDLLKQNRPNCLKSDVCIGPSEGGLHTFLVGDPGGSDAFSGLESHMPADWIKEHRRHGSHPIKVQTKTLRTLLDEHKCPQVIDYLSLDVEGAEYAILRSFFAPPKLYRPSDYQFRFITVEFRYDQLLLEQLEQLLEPEYVLDEVRAFDACFVHRNLGVTNARPRAA